MECVRCHGLMVRDHVFDLLDTEIHGDVWRCISCGNILDPVILVNGRKTLSKTLVGEDAGVLDQFTAV